MPRSGSRSATCEAAPNIALVKYWGVRDEARALPYNSSLSVTLDRLRTRTRVTFDSGLAEDRFVLNGEVVDGAPRHAVGEMLDRIRVESGERDRAEVRSSNNFPTASGLASSASGFAALAGAAAYAAGLAPTPQHLSQIARFGSGSACRSIFGGFVEWRSGRRSDGRDCYATPLFPEDHWPELVDLVALVADAPTKAVRSARAMQLTVATSPEFSGRQREIPGRLARIRRAIGARDASALFPAIMEECDSFRRVCETTTPPLDYLTGTSRAILAAVDEVNRGAGRPVAAYTHDAGAHVHVFLHASDVPRMRRRLAQVAGIAGTRVLHAGPGARRVG
ncbi:MAG: diphosphomevalonate decarboxylase [Thermoplasmata archaeon]